MWDGGVPVGEGDEQYAGIECMAGKGLDEEPPRNLGCPEETLQKEEAEAPVQEPDIEEEPESKED